ncbi:MAG: hypothetical protein KBF83_07990 [Pyrinomonadaceae bacterium]|nr:hypothetical protein [Pyrinomonadaceae bacterium]
MNIRSRNHGAVITTSTIFILGLTIWIAGWGAASLPFEDSMEVSSKAPVFEREADDPDGRASWFMEQRIYPFEKVPDNARRDAWQDVVNRGEGFGPAGIGTTWTQLGPAPTSGNGPGGVVSGRINAIAISPANTQLILVAGATGGIWRSTNGGTTFVPVTDSLVDLAVGTIAFAPSDPNIVYAGLGDSDNGYWGNGVLRSNDAGATWTRVNNTSIPNRVQATRILVDPTNPNRVYITLNTFQDPTTGDPALGGVLVSTNGGVNWTAPLRGLATDLAIHPTNPQILYAALRFGSSAAVPRGVFKSTNGGQTWTNILASPYTAAQSSTKDIRVAVTPADPDRLYVYFGTDGPPKEVRLEVSTDAGATFTDRGVISNDILDPGQFGYNTFLEASPTDADTVYVGSRDTFRSTDGGVTFTNLNNSFAPPYDPGTFTESLQKVHTDQQAFAFEPGSSTTFYVGNDGGIFKTTNSGATFTSLNNTLSLVQFIGISIHPTDPNRSYAGAQDNGSQRRVGVGQIWREFVGGDGGKSVVNPVDPTMVFPSYTNGNIGRVTNNGSGPSSVIATTEVFGEQGTERIGFYPPIVSNGFDPRIYSGSWRLFICADCNDLNKEVGTANPPTWTAPGGMFDQTFGGTDVLSAITVAPSQLNTIYTGSTQGRAMVSTNGGTTWTDISTGLPQRSIRNITVSPTDPALVYLTVSGYRSGHIFRSNNAGTTWTDISNNLPDIPVSAFLIDRLTPTTLYAGTDIGVFRSTDNGGSWTVFNNGMPPAPVMEFTSQASGLIQIATYGRGVYELRPAGVPTPTPTSTPTATPTPAPAGSCAFSNGGLNPQPLSENFTEPPPGFLFSELQHAAGVTTEANGTFGFSATQGTGRIADNFTLSQPCNISTVAFYGYVTGSAATPSPFTGLTLQIWNGRPGDAGSTIVFGDATTNRMASSVDTTYFRILNTAVPVTGTPPGTTRRIWRNTATVGTLLPAGTYWLDWAVTGGGGAGNFAPAKTVPSARNAAGDNARRLTVSTGVWADILDGGLPTTAPDVPQDMPFDVVGSTTGTPTPTATPTATPTPTPSAGFEGDLAPRPNGDGSFAANDVVQARRFVSGLDTPSTATSEFQRTDSAPRTTFGDGGLNASDVVQTRRYASGLDPQTAAGGPTAPATTPGLVSDLFDSLYAFFFGSELRVEAVETQAGTPVTIPVQIISTGDEAAVSFTIEYDANRLGNPRIAMGDAMGEGADLTANSTEPGSIGILVDSAEAMSASAKPRDLVLVTFDVAPEAAGDVEIQLTESTAVKSASDPFGNGLSMRWIDGYVKISSSNMTR